MNLLRQTLFSLTGGYLSNTIGPVWRVALRVLRVLRVRQRVRVRHGRGAQHERLHARQRPAAPAPDSARGGQGHRSASTRYGAALAINRL